MKIYELTYHDKQTGENEMVCESLNPEHIKEAFENDQRNNGHRLKGLYDVLVSGIAEFDSKIIPNKIMDWPQFRAAYLNNNDK